MWNIRIFGKRRWLLLIGWALIVVLRLIMLACIDAGLPRWLLSGLWLLNVAATGSDSCTAGYWILFKHVAKAIVRLSIAACLIILSVFALFFYSVIDVDVDLAGIDSTHLTSFSDNLLDLWQIRKTNCTDYLLETGYFVSIMVWSVEISVNWGLLGWWFLV